MAAAIAAGAVKRADVLAQLTRRDLTHCAGLKHDNPPHTTSPFPAAV